MVASAGHLVTRYSARGFAYQEWEPPVPRIRDPILDCVVYLYPSKHEAMEGFNIGGTGFLLSVPTEKLTSADFFVYAVTNRHVVVKGATCVRLNTKEGDIDAFEYRRDQWIVCESDDLAIRLLPNISNTFRINAIPRPCLVTKEMVIRHDIGVGDDILMVGRFINREGIQRNSPTARFGHIAQMPGDPLITNDGTQEEAFIAEIRSIGGYSGSPVFLLPNPIYSRQGEAFPSDMGLMLGVDFCHIQDWTCARDDRGREYQNEQRGDSQIYMS